MADDDGSSGNSSSNELLDNSDSQENSNCSLNAFANDGSFLEIFKRKMEEERRKKATEFVDVADCSGVVAETEQSDNSLVAPRRNSSLAVGKRRGGKVLPTGLVKKPKKDGVESSVFNEKKIEDTIINAERIVNFPDRKEKKNDAWSQYMAEVKKYKERSCEDDGKTRPLVK